MKKILGSLACSLALVGCEGTPTYDDVAYVDGYGNPVVINNGNASHSVYTTSGNTQTYQYSSSDALSYNTALDPFNEATGQYFRYSLRLDGDNQNVNVYVPSNNPQRTLYIDEIYVSGHNNTLTLPDNVVVSNYVHIYGVGGGNRVTFGNNASINYVEVLQDSNELRIGYNSTMFDNKNILLFGQNHDICLPSSIRATYVNGSQFNNISLNSLESCRF